MRVTGICTRRFREVVTSGRSNGEFPPRLERIAVSEHQVMVEIVRESIVAGARQMNAVALAKPAASRRSYCRLAHRVV